MPFDPRQISRSTTKLPAALREELGLPASSSNHQNRRRNFRPASHNDRSNNRNGYQKGKSDLKVIGRPQSALNGAPKGTQQGRPCGPIKSLRNQEKEQQEQQQQRHKGNNITVSPNHDVQQSFDTVQPSKKRKLAEQPAQRELKVIKKPNANKDINADSGLNGERSERVQLTEKTRVNPFTGELETIKTSAKPSSRKRSALQKMVDQVEAGASSSSSMSKVKSAEGSALHRKSRRHMSQQEKEEEDEIKWLEYQLKKQNRAGPDGEEIRDDLDDFLDDLDRFQVGMFEADSEDKDTNTESGSESEPDSETDSASDSDIVSGSQSDTDSSLGTESEDGSSVDETEDDNEDEEEKLESKGSVDVHTDMDLEDDEALYDFDSNDEADFSNWDAAMATTDEEEEEEDDEEGSVESDAEEELDSEEEEARALIEGSAGAYSTSRAPPPLPPSTSDSTPSTSVSGKYIPPALRNKMMAEAASPASEKKGADDEDNDIAAQKLRRQAQGLLNRLGDSNIDTILNEYQSLYRTHPRARVTSTIAQLVLDTVTSRSNLVDTFVILHAAFIASLYKVVGVEFAAYFVQKLVDDLLKHYRILRAQETTSKTEVEEQDERGKECLNLTVLACHLYNLQVIACPLIYDLIRMFLGQSPSQSGKASSSDADRTGGITEMDIELLLKTIRSCGQQLRSDDPTSLRSIVELTKSSLSKYSGGEGKSSKSLSARSKFMLERMEMLEKSSGKKKSSGNMHDGSASDPNSASGQLLAKMKKYLSSMAKKHTIKSYDALRIGLKDLLDSNKKGKWWVVGAAWTGQVDQEDAQGLTKMLPMNAKSGEIQAASSSRLSTFAQADDPGNAAAIAALHAESQDLARQQAELSTFARSLGINTDIRRQIFFTLLGAQDYKQAVEKVLLLKLTEVQRREIPRILIQCLGTEQTYNPYYTLIGQELLKHNHSMKITLQYCLWDFLRELGETEVGGQKFSSTTSDFDTSSSPSSASSDVKIANLARAFGWWIRADCLHLQSLKTIDFTLLIRRTQPTQFLGLLIIHTLLSCQPGCKSPSKTLLLATKRSSSSSSKGTFATSVKKLVVSHLSNSSNVDLLNGLILFLNTKLDSKAQKKLILGKEKKLEESMKPLLELVETGVRVMLDALETLVKAEGSTTAGLRTDDLDGDLDMDTDMD